MRKTVTVVPDDHIIIVEGIALSFPYDSPADLHALQWADGQGHIEHKDGRPNRPIGPEEYETAVAPFVAAFEAEEARILEEATRPPTLPEARAIKLAEINGGYAAAIATIQAGYPDEEVLSWERQASQARELGENPDAPALFVRSLAAKKGLAVEEMCRRILANAEAWEPVAALLTAERQLLEERLHLAESIDRVAGISVSFSV